MEMSRFFCNKDKHEIQDIYEDVCGDWKYWNPWYPPDESDPMFRKCCRSCACQELVKEKSQTCF